MKQNKLLKPLLAVLLLALLPQTAAAYDFMVGGLCYNRNDDGTSVYVTNQKSVGPSYSNLSSNLVIPATVTYSGKTYSVTSIGGNAFWNCSGLTSVTIPNSVTSIGNYAFWYCSGLTSVTIGNSVTSIGTGAFRACSGLTSLTIPNSVTSIGTGAFRACSGLTSLTIPNSVTSIGASAFCECRGLTSVTIPNSVTSIGASAFCDCSGLTSVSIPNSVSRLGALAFYNCSGLKTVSIGTGLVTMDLSTGDVPLPVFSGCNALTSVTWNAKNCADFTSSTTPFSAANSSIKSFTIGGQVQRIPAYLCYQMTSLTSVTIPNSVTSIGSEAFKGCSGLTSLTIPNSVTSIGSEAFKGCSGLESMVVEAGNTKYDSRDNCNAIIETASNTLVAGCKATTIPNSVTTIGGCAFLGCSGLTSVTIPNSVTSIRDGAFDGCSGIKKLTWNAINCSSMGDMPKGNIEQVTIGDGVEVLPGGFVSGSKITSVTIPNSVTSIGDYAFQGCSGIKKLTWNAINYSSMGDMPKGNIEQVTIGDGVEVLPSYFVEGSKITSVTIPNSVTSIGDYAFQGCSGLLLVYSKIVEPEGVQLGDNVFAGIPFATCKLYVPGGTIASYQSADQWKDFLMIVDCYDVNLDGTIDIADVNAVVNKMLERDGAPTKERADVNRDDDVDIFDVNEVISAMLGIGNLPEPPCATQTYTVNGVSFTMIGVQGGPFTMGATAEQGSDVLDSEKPAHRVTLSNYTIGQTEVTQELWQAVMGSNPSHFTGDLQRPVENVSWDDCQTFITKLNQLTGKNFRLPTEAEWEYAARGGNQSQGYKYAGSDNVDEVAWYWKNACGVGSGSPNYGTHAVATKFPNELGLYDMSGNVYEWCQDWYGSYRSYAQTNPTGPTSGSYRVGRGGSWDYDAGDCRVSYRYGSKPSYSYYYLGLRLAL